MIFAKIIFLMENFNLVIKKFRNVEISSINQNYKLPYFTQQQIPQGLNIISQG